MKTPDFNLPRFDKEASSSRSRVSQAQDQMPSPSPRQRRLGEMAGGAEGRGLKSLGALARRKGFSRGSTSEQQSPVGEAGRGIGGGQATQEPAPQAPGGSTR